MKLTESANERILEGLFLDDPGESASPFAICETGSEPGRQGAAHDEDPPPPTLSSVGSPPVKESNPKDQAAQTRIPLALCSPIAKAEWALAQFAGMAKYGAWNWRACGVRSSVYLHAMQRHIDAYVSGEETDPIDGTHHLGNVMACAAILLDAREAGKLTDDRPPSVGLRAAYKRLETLMGTLVRQYADRMPRHYTIADTARPESER